MDTDQPALRYKEDVPAEDAPRVGDVVEEDGAPYRVRHLIPQEGDRVTVELFLQSLERSRAKVFLSELDRFSECMRQAITSRQRVGRHRQESASG